MTAVRVVVETNSTSIEYVVHVRNRSRHALNGALRSAFRKYPDARRAEVDFIEHTCPTCGRSNAAA